MSARLALLNNAKTGKDVDLNRNRIAIRKTKTDESRQVPISSALRPILVELVRDAEFRGQQYLFTNRLTKTRYGRIKTAWMTACKLAGISNLHIHDLRRTFGTRAADNGAPLTGLQKVMGHKRIETTMIYARGTEDGMERAVNAAQNPGHKSVTNLLDRRKTKVGNG